MHFVPFCDYFPEIGLEENRCFTVLNDPNLPKDLYCLMESYCSDPECDCRRVMFSVVTETSQKPLAVINYGWEKLKFYEKWCASGIKEAPEEIKGPALNSFSPQSELAPYILEVVASSILTDKSFIKRLQKHYQMFKRALTRRVKTKQVESSKKIGRNDPCPCGSGKKYKKCCLQKNK